MGNYIKYTKEQLEQANKVDLAEFLKQQGEALEKSGKEVRWLKNSSVTIRGNRWFQHKYQEGGYPIRFLQKFYNYTFQEAVNTLLEGSPALYEGVSEASNYEFHAPEKSMSMKRLYGYLLNQRCIDYDVLRAFIQKGLIYESGKYHNVVFAGMDENGEIRHAHKRATYGNYRSNELGSDPQYSFHWTGTSNEIKVFEAPIDLLSYISLHKDNWQSSHYVALNGVSIQALMYQISQHSNLNEITLCLDHDIAGDLAMSRIRQALEDFNMELKISKEQSQNKDWNEDLKEKITGEIGQEGIDNPMKKMYYSILTMINDKLKLPEHPSSMKSIMDQYMDFFSILNDPSRNNNLKLYECLTELSMKAMDYYQQITQTDNELIEEMMKGYYSHEDRGSIAKRIEQLKDAIHELKQVYVKELPHKELMLQKKLLGVANKSMLLYANYLLSDCLQYIKEGMNLEQIDKPKCPLLNADGNIFNLIMLAEKSLIAIGDENSVCEMKERIMSFESYGEAIDILTDYVIPVTSHEINEKVFSELQQLKAHMDEAGLLNEYKIQSLKVMNQSKSVEDALEMIKRINTEFNFSEQITMVG